MARLDSLTQETLEVHAGRKLFIQKIALTAATGVITTIGTTDVYGNTLPKNYTLVIQPIGTDIYYELRATGTTTAITDVSSTRPGVYVPAKAQELTTPLGSNGGQATIIPKADAMIDIYPVGNGTALLFWAV